MAKRYFSPAEVGRLIPELEAIIGQLRDLERDLREKERHLHRARIERYNSGEPQDDLTFLKEEAGIDFIRILAKGLFDRVREMGGEVKQGFLVDFPGQVEGQEVLLCWRPGEQEVLWYHGLQEGMLGRKPIPPELLGEQGGETGTGEA